MTRWIRNPEWLHFQSVQNTLQSTVWFAEVRSRSGGGSQVCFGDLDTSQPGMFTIPRLPAKFQSPFGILGDDARLLFRTAPNGVLRPAAERVRGVPFQEIASPTSS